MSQTCRSHLPPLVHRAINFATSSMKKGGIEQPVLFYLKQGNSEIEFLQVGHLYDSTAEGRDRLRDVLRYNNASSYALVYEAYWVILDPAQATKIDVSASRKQVYRQLGCGNSLANHPDKQEIVLISYQVRGEAPRVWFSFLSRKQKRVRLGGFIDGLKNGGATLGGLTVTLFNDRGDSKNE